MEKTLKEKWIQALVDGSYQQGKYDLITESTENERYCPLGVLCDVAGLIKVPVALALCYYMYTNTDGITSKGSRVLPHGFAEAQGMTVAGCLKVNFVDLEGVEIASLVILNDDYDCTFSQIADFIKAGMVKGV